MELRPEVGAARGNGDQHRHRAQVGDRRVLQQPGDRPLPHDQGRAIFKELVAHVAVSTLSDVLGRKNHITDVYIAPGIRFGLDRDQKWYVLGAIQVPVSGPQPYDWLSSFALLRNY